ncbi:unnamed protein product, partial [Adineta steineri]
EFLAASMKNPKLMEQLGHKIVITKIDTNENNE